MRSLVFVAVAVAASLGLAGCHRNSADLGDPALDAHSSKTTSEAHASAPDTTAVQPAAAASAAASAPAVSARSGSGDTEAALLDSTDNPAAIMGAAASNVSDPSITAQVRSAFAGDRQLQPLGIDVDTENGIVTLSGLAPTASDKAHADEVARTVKGVVSVNNQLTLPSG